VVGVFDCSIGQSHHPSKEIDDDHDHDVRRRKDEHEHDDEVDAVPPWEFQWGSYYKAEKHELVG
jgi:hypothetical protein